MSVNDKPRLAEHEERGTGAVTEKLTMERKLRDDPALVTCVLAIDTLDLIKAIYHIDLLPLPSKAKVILSSHGKKQTNKKVTEGWKYTEPHL